MLVCRLWFITSCCSADENITIYILARHPTFRFLTKSLNLTLCNYYNWGHLDKVDILQSDHREIKIHSEKVSLRQSAARNKNTDSKSFQEYKIYHYLDNVFS